MPRPTTLPTWATSGANTLEPSSGKKAAGWLPGEQPPAGYFNWLWGSVTKWVGYLDDERASLAALFVAFAALPFARRDLPNTFAHPLTVDFSDNEVPLVTSTKLAADGGTPTADWKLVFAFRCKSTDSRMVRLYSGREPEGISTGGWMLTVNALYSTNTDNWYPDDSAFHSSCWMLNTDGVSVFGAFAGTAPWTTWPVTSGGKVTARFGSFVNGGISAGALGVTSTGPVVALGVGAADFNYPLSHPAVDLPIDLSNAYGDALLQPDGSLKAGPSGRFGFHIRLAAGCSFAGIDVNVEQATTARTLVSLDLRDPPDWVSPGGSSLTNIDVFQPANAAGFATCHLAGVSGVQGLREYSLTFVAGHADDCVHAVRVRGFVNPGPRNY